MKKWINKNIVFILLWAFLLLLMVETQTIRYLLEKLDSKIDNHIWEPKKVKNHTHEGMFGGILWESE